MKKLKLKKQHGQTHKTIGYKIAYDNELNPAQYEAVMHNNGPALVIAGAGTGKTRTLTYRVARLIEDGVRPESILLLTFTRKASREMIRRAAGLLDGRCERISGGTFHSFSLGILRRWAEKIGYGQSFNVLDQGDSEDVINLLRTNLKLASGKRRFPQKSTLMNIHSMSINKRIEPAEFIEQNYPHYVDETEKIELLFTEYNKYKKAHNLMDYDDLLTNLLLLLKNHRDVLKEVNNMYKYTMVDEYQDTNRLQHEIVLLLGGPKGNILAVGDDAQSIYSFRGAEFDNIIFFPDSFDKCVVFKIEENYRSTQPILSLTNDIIDNADVKYDKKLFSRKTEGEKPILISARNERQQSQFVVQQVLEFSEQGIPLEEMGVLFRSGFMSFDLEIELNKSNIPYQKFGGMKFSETAHIKDIIAYLRVMYNPLDAVSWQRILLLLGGVGPRTAQQIIEQIISTGGAVDLSAISRGKANVKELVERINQLGRKKYSVGEKVSVMAEYYYPIMKKKYDDYTRRKKDVEMFLSIAERYSTLSSFLNDMALDPPVESLAELEPESKEDDFLTISTIHSAKGLEFTVVFIIWALEGRFPSARAADSIEQIEEERRLFYVAATRAKDYLFISYPTNIFDRESGFVLSRPTRFIEGITDDLIEKYALVDDEDEDEDISKN